MSERVEHLGYTGHLEYGVWVWYKTTRSETFAKSSKTGKEIRLGTHMNRVVTTAPDIDGAKEQLSRKLSPPKPEAPIIVPTNQLKMF